MASTSSEAERLCDSGVSLLCNANKFYSIL